MALAVARRPVGSTHNLFFTIYPDRHAADRIEWLQAEVRDRHGLRGKPVAKARLHISLNGLGVFYGARPMRMVAEACDAVSRIRLPSFVVAFNMLENWNEGPKALVMSGDEGDIGVRGLHARIHDVLAHRGLVRGREPSFNPHLTLLRDWRDTAEETIRQVEWRVREFRLVDSLYGLGRHDLLGRWALD